MPSYLFVPIKPKSGEEGNYNRRPVLFYFLTKPIVWWWVFSDNWKPANDIWPQIRMLVDGVPVTDFVSRTDGYYNFTFDVPDGNHITGFEGLPDGVPAVNKAFSVSTTGQPFPDNKIWIATTRYEYTEQHIFNMSVAQVEYPGQRPIPKLYPQKPRAIEKYNTLLPLSQLWVRRLQMNNRGGMVRRFVSLPGGHIDVEPEQVYFYDDVRNVRLNKPVRSFYDGPRGVGTFGSVYKFIISPADTGTYFSDPMGRLGFMRFSDGQITTFAGFRSRADVLRAHGGIKSNNYMNRTLSSHLKWYDDTYEVVGDWSRVPGVKQTSEPWGFDGVGSEPGGGLHEFWWADTLNGRILYVDHWTAHSPETYQKAIYPAPGYVPPDQPIGQPTVAVFADGLEEPWDCAITEINGVKWLYWTEFVGNRIRRKRLDGSGPMEIVYESLMKPTDAEMGISRRLLSSPIQTAVLRANFLRDGVQGVASGHSPQGIAFDSLGRLTWAERYMGSIRRMENGVITSFIQDVGQGTDVTISIDTEGTCGPKDDIFVGNWDGDSARRWGIDGTYRGGILGGNQFMLNGPADQCRRPHYSWAVAARHGRIIHQGSGGAYQFVEITKRLPTDPVLDGGRADFGLNSGWRPAQIALTHGSCGEGELGFPTVDELGEWDDATLIPYLLSHGVKQEKVEDVVYWIRSMTVENVYEPATGTLLNAPQTLTAQVLG